MCPKLEASIHPGEPLSCSGTPISPSPPIMGTPKDQQSLWNLKKWAEDPMGGE